MPQIRKVLDLEIILSKGLGLLPSSSIGERVLKDQSLQNTSWTEQEHLWQLNGASSPNSCHIQIARRSNEHGLSDLNLVPLLC